MTRMTKKRRPAAGSSLLSRQLPPKTECLIRGILLAMNSDSIHLTTLVALAIKLLAKFGLIPGFVAAFGVQKIRQKYRQRKAVEGWPSTDATIQWCKVHKEGVRNYWVEVTYS